VSVAIMTSTQALAVTIYGGPTYDSDAVSGFTYPSYHNGARNVEAGDGVAFGGVDKFEDGVNLGPRAVRWGPAIPSPEELGGLGFDNEGVGLIIAAAINKSDNTLVGVVEKYDEGVSRGDRAVRWDSSSTSATELGVLGFSDSGYTNSAAYAINQSGVAAGFARKYERGNNKGDRAVRWNSSGTEATELSHLGTSFFGNTHSRASAINNAGNVAGYAIKYDDGKNLGIRAVRWDATGTQATELGVISTHASGTGNSRALDINNHGAVVGYGTVYDGTNSLGPRAIRWNASSSVAVELDNLGLDGFGRTFSQATAINDLGTAIGFADKYESGINRGFRAVRWDSNGTEITELGQLGPHDGSTSVFSINNAGWAVGRASKFDSTGRFIATRAVAWGPDGVALDLNTLLDPDSGWVSLVEAGGISDSGWISGTGLFDPDGAGGQSPYTRLFLLDATSFAAVPEPATAAVLAGLMGFTAARRRRG